MSCQMKRVRENYQPRRTAFDQMMAKVYDPTDRGNAYHSAPWPMDRTEFDVNLQQKWCPKCTSASEIVTNPPMENVQWNYPPY